MKKKEKNSDLQITQNNILFTGKEKGDAYTV